MKLVTRKLFNGECMKKRITLIVFSVLIIVALYVLYCFNYIPHKKYTNADFNIEAYKSNIDKDNDGIDDQTDILNNANNYIKTNPKYKSKYYNTGYPDDEYGVCTDVVAFALKDAGYNCFLGGNIGIPLFTQIKNMTPNDIVVLEMSSFQLMDMEVSPNISVITNIAPNHLDIHKSYEEYIDSKKNIFKYQKENSTLVINYDNEITKKFVKEAKGNVIYFSSKNKLDNGVIFDDGMIKICKDGIRRHILAQKDMKLRGVHNCENACAAIAATASLVSVEEQIKTIQEFSGVEHRLELVRNINGVNWYNDSIGTSPSRTIAGLNSFNEKIVLIAGGYDKHLDYTPIAKPIVDNVSKLILMGATADKIHDAVVKELTLEQKSMPIYHCSTLKETVELANKIVEKGEIVLFSPASASFDLFKNFAERGDKFKELVNEL